MKRFLLCLLLVGGVAACSNATTLSASDVLTRARVYLRDQSTSANRQQFPDATLLQFLSDGQREANAQNWLLQYSFSITLSSGITRYLADKDCMGIMRVWYTQAGSSSILKLDQTSMDQLDAQSADWLNARGPPTRYYIDRRGGFYVGFFPIPSASVPLSTGTVVVHCVEQTTDVTSLSDIPFTNDLLLQPYVSALAYYIAYRGFLTVEETDLANAYLQYWINFLSLMRQGTTKTPDFNPGFIGQHGPP